MEIKLYEWQKKALQMSKEMPNLALFAEVGTGKTCTAIQIMRDRFNNRKEFLRTLILGPLSVLYNWEKEILKFSKIEDNRIFVSIGSGNSRVKKLGNFISKFNKGIVIMNYEGIRNKDIFFLLSEWQPQLLICDESHLLKNSKAQMSKAVYSISKEAIHRYLLTGTPILNSSMDIYMQYKILDLGETFGSNFFSFRNRYFVDANARWSNSSNHYPKFVPIESKNKELTDKIYKKAIRVLKSECLDLPPKIEQVKYAPLNAVQLKLYKEMKQDFITFINDNRDKTHAVVAQLALTKALRLQQIVSGFVIDEDGKTHDLGMIPRIEVLENDIEQIKDNHKFILWCCFKHNYKQLGDMLTRLKVKHVFLTGEQSATEKQIAIDAFENDPDVRGIIANRRAGGTGVNLIEASYSYIYSRNFSLAEEIQSDGRNHRGGSQKHACITKVDLCAPDTIDVGVLDALKNKREISEKIIDLVGKF